MLTCIKNLYQSWNHGSMDHANTVFVHCIAYDGGDSLQTSSSITCQNNEYCHHLGRSSHPSDRTQSFSYSQSFQCVGKCHGTEYSCVLCGDHCHFVWFHGLHRKKASFWEASISHKTQISWILDFFNEGSNPNNQFLGGYSKGIR